MQTVAVIAEDYLWEKGLSDCPGALLPDAKEKLDLLLAGGNRVIVCTPCSASFDGAKRCKAILECDLGYGLGPRIDLHVSFGIPVFDKLVHAGCQLEDTK